MNTKNYDKRKIKDFKKLKKDDLIEIIYQLESMNLALKAKIVELERIVEERGNLLSSFKSVIESNENIVESYKSIVENLKRDNARETRKDKKEL